MHAEHYELDAQLADVAPVAVVCGSFGWPLLGLWIMHYLRSIAIVNSWIVFMFTFGFSLR